MTAATYQDTDTDTAWAFIKRGLRRTPPPVYGLAFVLFAAGIFCLYMSWVTYGID